jgi:hypothetical protein
MIAWMDVDPTHCNVPSRHEILDQNDEGKTPKFSYDRVIYETVHISELFQQLYLGKAFHNYNITVCFM